MKLLTSYNNINTYRTYNIIKYSDGQATRVARVAGVVGLTEISAFYYYY